ncbi:Limbin [Bagarius yarrelli]|uniref:Limbin n=1 Tax=Bagarius yarrelli TaxID=175774 RepID=A0A556TVM7_BAGYA|nr:Limbin [Bagarius yarrelli]
MLWSYATFSFRFACILLCSARAVHRRHNAFVPSLKPEDNGTLPVPDESSAGGQNEEVALRSAAPEGLWRHSLYALIDQLSATVTWRSHQREARHTLPQVKSVVKSSELDVQFHKCAQVVTESEFPQIRVNLEVKNLESGTDLLHVSIRDTVSDIISLHSDGNVQDKEYQTFSTETLPAGSSYNVSYTMSVKDGVHDDLFLPAFLTFSSISQNDILSFSPVMANFTLRIDTTEKVCVNHALHFAGFCLAFLISTLLLAFTLLTAGCFYKKYLMCTPQHRKRRSFNIEAEQVEVVGNTVDLANEDAAFEDRIIDIMTQEDPHNVSSALDKLELSSLLRAAVMVECVRVQMLKGVFRLLTAGLSESGNDISVVDLLSHVTDMQEDQNSQHPSSEVQYEQQNAEQRRLETFRRREELHTIISEEIEEVAITRGTHMANQLLHRYYSCQDQLESVLDLFIANQRAALSEQQAQRRFLLQGLQDLQHSMHEMFSVFSRHIDGWFTHIRREGALSTEHYLLQLERAQSDLQRAQICFKERLAREHSSARDDIIKTRRVRISETLSEQKLEQQDLVCGSVCDVPLEDYLMRWRTLLCAHNTHLSELITHLDQEAAAHIRRVLVCVLRDAVADLKQVECETSESLQVAGVPSWLLLQLRAGNLWESQFSLSESDLLRMQLEYVKSVCHLDCCLVLPHVLPREKRCNTLTNQSTKHTPDHSSSDTCSIFTHAQVCVCENAVCVCEDELSMCKERVTTQVAAVQWDKLERKKRVVETHSALLKLQTLLFQAVLHAPAGEELSQAIHTHSLALEEAELLLQKEEADWERSMDGLWKLLTLDEELFQVNTEGTITECLREALYKRQQLTHTLTERLLVEPSCHLVDRLRNDVISKHKAPGSNTHTGRMLRKKQKLAEKLFSTSRADRLGHDPVPASIQSTSEAATQKEETCAYVVEQTDTPQATERPSHSGEVETAAEGDTVEEKLFTVHSAQPPHTEDVSQVSDGHRKRRKFKFRKGAVAPLEQM